jgi:hypothetical protein
MTGYIDPDWLTYTTDDELAALERWLANQKQPATRASRQIYGVVKALITGEIERRWQRKPRKGGTDPKRKTRQGATNSSRAKQPHQSKKQG